MINHNENAIIVKDLYKQFKLPNEQYGGIKQLIINFFKKKKKRNKGYTIQRVLNDISFNIHEGEFFGIVGRNGSGKSTLLKLLAGIYVPDSGAIQVNGSLTPFIELGVGFDPELTGRENIFLNGALLGFGHEEVFDMYRDIVSFAELDDFMDQKLKNYSSGMQVRLAFSIAIKSKSDILLFDEVLAVGDADFQKKCVSAFYELKKQGRTIILVTHDMSNVERFCDRALVLSNGKILALTTPKEASMLYAKLNVDEEDLKERDKQANLNSNRQGSGEIRIDDVILSNNNGPTRLFETGREFIIDIKLDRKKVVNGAVAIGLAIHDNSGLSIVGPNTEDIKLSNDCIHARYKIKNMPIHPGDYALTVAIYNTKTRENFDILYQAWHFSIIGSSNSGGIIDIDGKWELK